MQQVSHLPDMHNIKVVLLTTTEISCMGAHTVYLWDWSLITGSVCVCVGGGGGYKMGTFCVPPAQDRGKTVCAFTFKEWELFAHPRFNMAKTSSYHVKTTPKLFVPPLSIAKTFSAPSLFVGVKLHMPPSRCVAPHPP